MRNFFTVSALILSSLTSETALAQSLDTSLEDKPDQDFTGKSIGSGTGLGLPLPEVSIKSDVTGDAVKLTFSTASDRREMLASSGFSVSLNAPFNKKNGEGRFLTQAGLPGTLSLDAALNWSWLPNVDRNASRGPSSTELLAAEVHIRKACRAANAANPDKCSGDIRVLAGNDFAATADQKVITDYYNLSDDAMRKTNYVGLTLTGSIGKDKLTYRNSLTFAEASQSNTLFSIGASIGYVPNISKPLGLFVGGEFKRYYELPDAETRCPVAAGGATSVTCFTAAYSAPVRKTDAIVFAAARLNGGVVGKALSAELKFSYEPAERRWGVTLPVYFIKNKEGSFNGGIKFDWQSDTNEPKIGLFIGTTFDFLKR
jgi:hypothetical protein